MVTFGIVLLCFASFLAGYMMGVFAATKRLYERIRQLEKNSMVCDGLFHVFGMNRTACRCGKMTAGRMLAKARNRG